VRTLIAATAVALAAVGTGGALATSPPPPPPGGTSVGSRALDAKPDTKQEVPRPKGAGTGKGTFHASGSFLCDEGEQGCDRQPGKLKWTLAFSGLTGPAVAAHIHVGRPGKSGAVLIALCGPCKGKSSGTFRVTRAAMKAILDRGAYVNVHTARNKAGEIRGRIRASAVL